MEKFSRRAFTRDTFRSMFTLALVQGLCKAELIVGAVKPVASEWVVQMELLSRGLRAGHVRPIEWQQQIESLLSRVELSDLLSSIDYQRMAKTAILPADHESAEDISFSQSKGLPADLSFAPYFYAMKKGVSIVPHGHHNMATMHMVLHGQAHGRHFDRVADEPGYLTIKPTKDKIINPGEVTTISDEMDNVHWFKALTEPVFMFNIGVFGLKSSETTTGRDYIDPLNGESLKDGLIRAKRLNRVQAYRLYGKS